MSQWIKAFCSAIGDFCDDNPVIASCLFIFFVVGVGIAAICSFKITLIVIGSIIGFVVLVSFIYAIVSICKSTRDHIERSRR